VHVYSLRCRGTVRVVQHWRLTDFTADDGSRSPEILHSQVGESRVVLIHLKSGQELGDHEVKEAALLLVADGSVRVEAGDESVDGQAGMLFRFEPEERHSVSADGGDARILLVLAPWPGQGHYRGATDAQASSVSASSPDAA
jgi:quercetin dioxygenase-like cupin family protein